MVDASGPKIVSQTRKGIMIWWPFFIGISSYIPIANINLGLLYLSAARKRQKAFALWVVAVLFEGLYCFASLRLIGLLADNVLISQVLSFLIIVVFIGLGIWNFVQSPDENLRAEHAMTRKAYFAAIVHPQQIPFWLIWGAYLSPRGLLIDDPEAILNFALWNSLGSAITLGLYSIAGIRLKDWVMKRQKFLSKVVGMLCFGFALLEIWRMVW